MGYMAGDYGGGYAAGDYMAGGLFSSLAGVVKGAVKGFSIGGPLGAIAGARAGLPARHHDTNPSTLPAVAPPVTHSGAIDTFLRTGGRFTKAGRAKLTAEHNAALQPKMTAPHHLLGGFGGRRHMRWTNPKALARAERRIHSAVKHMTKYIRWVHPHKAGGHAVPKFGRHKKR